MQSKSEINQKDARQYTMKMELHLKSLLLKRKSKKVKQRRTKNIQRRSSADSK